MKNVKIVSPLSENLDYVLYNINNYKPTILNSSQEILTKFVNVIVNYMKFISEKINLKNKTYYKFILERGIHTIIHVFTMVFYYTRNLDLTYYHSQKAYYFYIEFIEQISDESVTFLQLNSRDAILFVYKKTIYELNSDYIKNKSESNVENEKIFELLDIYTPLFKNIIHYLIHHKSFNYESNQSYLPKCCEYVQILNELFNKYKLKATFLEYLFLFTNSILEKDININNYLELTEDFIKRISKKKIVNEHILKRNIVDLDVNAMIQVGEWNKINDLIFSE
jgi:hypothetical protein